MNKMMAAPYQIEFNRMAILKGKTEGGSGGKRGHSNMDHWVYSHEIKTATRKHRRLAGKKAVKAALPARKRTDKH